jgi:PAS domain-containing protein
MADTQAQAADTTQQTTTQTADQTTQQTTTTADQTTQQQTQQTQQQADWRAGVTDPDLLEHAKRFNSLTDLVKGNVELRSERDKLKSTAIIKPGKDAKPEEVAAYRKAMGIPEAPEGYKFPDPPEGQQLSDEAKASRSAWAKTFHDHGVPATVAEALIGAFAAEAQQVQEREIAADKRYADEQQAKLDAKWGPDKDKNNEYANRGAAKLFGANLDAVRNLQDKSGRFVLDNALFKEALAVLGREMQESTLGDVLSDTERKSLDDEIASVRKQIEEAQNNRDTAKANQLFQKEQELLRKKGNAPIVGSQARAA